MYVCTHVCEHAHMACTMKLINIQYEKLVIRQLPSLGVYLRKNNFS